MQSLQLDYYSVERSSFHARQLLVSFQGTGLVKENEVKKMDTLKELFDSFMTKEEFSGFVNGFAFAASIAVLLK